jgi:hypothetical protein
MVSFESTVSLYITNVIKDVTQQIRNEESLLESAGAITCLSESDFIDMVFWKSEEYFKMT